MIRPMRMSDIQGVAALEQRCFSVPWSEHSLRESLDNPDYLFLVADEDGYTAGYGGMLLVADEGDITNIAVDESYRGRGIATKLTERLLEEGRKRGVREFTLEVRVGNKAAVHVYEKLGFVSEGVRRHFYEKPVEDALIMWKREPECDQ